MTEEKLLQKEKELEELQTALENREKAVKDLEKLRDNLLVEHQRRIKEVSEKEEKILLGKTKEIADKDSEIKKLDKEIAELKRDIEKLKLDIANLKNNALVEVEIYKAEQLEKVNKELSASLKKQLESIHQSTKEILSSVSDTIANDIKDLTKEYESLLAKYDDLAKEKVKLVEAERKKLEESLTEYEKKLEELGDLRTKQLLIEHREKVIDKREKQFEAAVNMRLNELYTELKNDVLRYQKRIEELNNQYHAVLAERDDLKLENERLKTTGVESLQNQLDFYRQKNAELESKYKAFTDYEYQKIVEKARKYDALFDEVNRLNSENAELNLQVAQLKADKTLNDKLAFENESLRLQISMNNTYLTKLKEELEDLKSRINDAASGTIASESIEKPYDKFTKCLKDADVNKDEIKWLDGILEKCEKSGFKFSKRLMYSFHTCLKTSSMSPLTVLAGISGTGKSKLPQLYARFGGLYFISLPVQPDWDSPQSLFGYFNSIEKRFNATTLLRAMVSFQKEEGDSENIYDLHDRVLLVLLDEMNLAHVELYFADLLSKLEEQRGQKRVETFEVDLGAGRDKYKIRLSRNIIWSGTMNEDETTKSLSDKVIDRGNVISFPRPVKFERYNDKGLEPESAMIKRSVWEDWNSSNNKLKITPEIDEIIESYCKAVMDINMSLKYVNRALGHRVWQSIENYMISHPIVIQHQDDMNELRKALQYAFEEAVVYKIVPKLRGIELSDEVMDQCLTPIKDVLSREGVANGIVADFDEAINNPTTSVFVWDSAKYLDKDYEF